MEQKAVYASAARTATPTAYTFNARQYASVVVVVDVTAIVTAPSITVTVDVFDALSAKWVNRYTGSAITTVSTTASTVVSGLAGQVRITVTHGNSNSITYSVSAHLAR
jgi:hypothetical protein